MRAIEARLSTYTATQVGLRAAEAGVEWAGTRLFGSASDRANFSFLGSFAKNTAINFVTGGFGKIGFAGRQGLEILGDTAYDVGVGGQSFGSSLAMNTVGSLGGELVGWGLQAGAKRLWSRISVAPVNGATIASPMRGNPAAIFHGYADLSKRQQGLLSSLGEYGSQVTVGKRAVSMKDLAALTAHTGDEFLMLTRKGERLIMRGSQQGFHGVVDDVWAKQMASQGWRWSGHTHPVLQGMSDLGTLMSSGGDRAILQAFGQSRSLILNSKGRWSVFDGN